MAGHANPQISPFISLVFACLALVCLLLWSATGWGFPDLLEKPAAKAQKFNRANYLDLAKAGDRLVAVGDYGLILYSDDQGASWQQAEVPVMVKLTAVDFVDAQQGWAVGHDGVILHSQDAGQTWSKQIDGPMVLKLIFESTNERFLAFEEEFNRLEAEASEDELDLLQERYDLMFLAAEDARYDMETNSYRPFMDVLFTDQRQGFAVGAYGSFLATEDGGKNWQDWSGQLDNLNRFHINSLAKLSSNRLMLAGEEGLLWHSDDQGRSWQAGNSPYFGSYYGIYQAGSTLYLYGMRGNLYYSRDQGQDWRQIRGLGTNSIMSAFSLSNGQVLFTGNAGLLINVDTSQQIKVSYLPGRRALMDGLQLDNGDWLLLGEKGINQIAPIN